MSYSGGMALLISVLTMAILHTPWPVPPAGPAVVVTLQNGCPCARECHVGLNALAAACAGRVRFVGLVDGDAQAARRLAREAELRFPVLPDPRLGTIRKLEGHEALDLRLVDGRGRIVGRWDGLCRASVAALVDAVRRTTGRDASLDLSPFTVTPKLGCAYPPAP